MRHVWTWADVCGRECGRGQMCVDVSVACVDMIL